ncbi:MAG: helix-turn-helix transcriptional regulator [Rhodospirillaceae bacterium]|nr:MAG: helix-turn-helix transcriptional regulator [Rhodospirillaceae bacterium]
MRDDSDILAPLLDGIFEEPLWATFLDRLRRRTRADYVALTFRPPGMPLNAVIHLYAGEPSPPPVSQHYHNHLYERDPLPYYQLREGRVYALHELLRFGEPEHDTFYRELLIPSGMITMRMMRVMEPSGVNAWLTLSRKKGDFKPSDGASIGAIAPYLRGALRTFVALERERFNASVAAEAIRRLDFGWLTLSSSGHVLDADAHGTHLLAHSNILRRSATGQLSARSKQLERKIAAAVRALAADPSTRPRAIVLSRDPWLDMLLIPTHKRSISAKPDPAVIAYIHGDRWSSADRCEQLAELFGLLPSESRLALALTRGMTIAEAACELGLTVETARNYSKKIYAKTGARGQPDLVRFVLRSVLTIA